MLSQGFYSLGWEVAVVRSLDNTYRQNKLSYKMEKDDYNPKVFL